MKDMQQALLHSFSIMMHRSTVFTACWQLCSGGGEKGPASGAADINQGKEAVQQPVQRCKAGNTSRGTPRLLALETWWIPHVHETRLSRQDLHQLPTCVWELLLCQSAAGQSS